MNTMQFFLFMIIFSLSLVRSSTDTKVWGELHRTVILPCAFSRGGEEVIHWTYRVKEQVIKVHSYFDGKDQLDKQDSNYSGRTSLFIAEVGNGNASLQLRNLKESDAVKYFCYVGTKTGSTEKNVALQVADFNHSIEYKWSNQQLHLKCYVNNPYLDDDVWIRWYVDKKQVQETKSTESNIIINSSSLSHHCIINHSVVTNTWTGNWERKESIEREDDNFTCECTFCKKSNFQLMAIYLLQNTTEQVTVAFKNSTHDTNVGENYRNRVHVVDYSLNLSRVTANDNGNYTCVMKTAEQMHIEMTCVNITSSSIEDKLQCRHHFHLIAFTLPLPFCLIYMLWKKRSQ